MQVSCGDALWGSGGNGCENCVRFAIALWNWDGFRGDDWVKAQESAMGLNRGGVSRTEWYQGWQWIQILGDDAGINRVVGVACESNRRMIMLLCLV